MNELLAELTRLYKDGYEQCSTVEVLSNKFEHFPEHTFEILEEILREISSKQRELSRKVK